MIAIAAAAQGNVALLVIGLAISIPLIVAGAALVMALLDRYPILVWAGGALLGWVAGDIMIKDDALKMQIDPLAIEELHIWAGVAGAVFVVAVGYFIRSRRHAAAKKEEVAAE